MNYREQVMQALNAILMGATFESVMGMTTWVNNPALSRKLKHFADLAMDTTAQPALYQVEHNEMMRQQGRGIPGAVTLKVSAVGYAYCANDSDIGGTFINNMVTGLEQALKSDIVGDNVCTLGGLVYKCWIEGETFKEPGDLDKQAMFVLPILISVPSTLLIG